MKNIYTGIDVGTDSIKIIVAEADRNKHNILASTHVLCEGLEKGMIVDSDLVIKSLKKAIKEIESMLGFKIRKAIFVVSSDHALFEKVTGYSTITNVDKCVTGDDIIRCLQGAVYNKLAVNFELTNILPVEFTLDDKVGISDPKGMVGSKLGVKALMVSVPKRNVYELINVAQTCNLEVIDITISGVADYLEFKNKDTDNYMGAVINIGHETTNVSVINKGIIISNEVIEIGSKNVDKDIDYVYKIGLKKACELKEKFAVAHKRYASFHDVFECVNKDQEVMAINQLEISEIVMSRLAEILKLAKKQINLLTNEKISYIIITGGVSMIPGFKYLVNETYGRMAAVGKMNTIGIRHNKFSTAMGAIRYFIEKQKLRDKEYSMFSEEERQELISTKKRIVDESSVLGKIIGYFFQE